MPKPTVADLLRGRALKRKHAVTKHDPMGARRYYVAPHLADRPPRSKG